MASDVMTFGVACGFYWVDENKRLAFEHANLAFDLRLIDGKRVDGAKAIAWLNQKINGNLIASRLVIADFGLYSVESLGFKTLHPYESFRVPYFCETSPTVEAIAKQIVSKMSSLFVNAGFVFACYSSRSGSFQFDSVPDDVLTPREWK